MLLVWYVVLHHNLWPNVNVAASLVFENDGFCRRYFSFKVGDITKTVASRTNIWGNYLQIGPTNLCS